MARNPFAFRACPVVFWTSLVYIALFAALIYVHEAVPSAPSPGNQYRGVNLTQAWLDLQLITREYHPYNSDENVKVRDYILTRINNILTEHGLSAATGDRGDLPASGHLPYSIEFSRDRLQAAATAASNVVVFNDMVSNVTMTPELVFAGTNMGSRSTCSIGHYFEGQNIIVYIRGQDDPIGEWWTKDLEMPIGEGGVLINSHFDSISTGFGATDDGVSVVTMLQLLDYYLQEGRKPHHGIVLLFNNGEEDGLYGAKAFAPSPLRKFCHTFINLEGAGAGGRAMLFRATDTEIVRAYRASPHPFGSVIASNAFGLGAVQSMTDYTVFHDNFGERGLDIAFYRPRARYHTNEDDARHTSRASVWHMLSAAIATSEKLSGDTSKTFLGPRPGGDKDENKVPNGAGSDGVWFDLFGSSFVVFPLRPMFALTLVMMILFPLVLALLTYILIRSDRHYFFTSSVNVSNEEEEDEKVEIGGWRGFSRFPVTFVISAALVLGAAFLVRKFNPLIIYSSEYAVWAMMLSLFYVAFWTVMRVANFARPSALHRGYVHFWLFILLWIIMIPVATLEDVLGLGLGYPFVFLFFAVFLATVVSLCELFALPKRSVYASQFQDEDQVRDYLNTPILNSDALISPSPGEIEPTHPEEPADGVDQEEEEPEPNETTPLRAGANGADNSRTTFTTAYRRSISLLRNTVAKNHGSQPFEFEQSWSGRLPSWTWLLQFCLVAPLTIILFGQTGLFLSAAVSNTAVDGSNTLLPFLLVAVTSILLLLPTTPFIHRVSWHLPVFLFAVFVGTLVYNLTAFPFSPNSRYKAFFQQSVDLDTGASVVKIGGLAPFVQDIVGELPSSAGKLVTCVPGPRPGLTSCQYDGSTVPPNLSRDLPEGIPPEKGYADLVSVNVSRPDPTANVATLSIDAKNTKVCFLNFSQPIKSFAVRGGAELNPEFGKWPENGLCHLKLWRRDPSQTWTVDIAWDEEEQKRYRYSDLENVEDDAHAGAGLTNTSDELKRRQKLQGSEAGSASGLDGRCVCYWSDANTKGTIPSFDEVIKYAPTWVAITKTNEALVEGSKSFMI